MDTIKTFIFLDLETTGLPSTSNPTKITEIALVAASRDEILETHRGVSKENSFGESFLPRVINKLNFAVYPRKMIQPKASTVSGLTNENLEQQQPFNEHLVKIIHLFMERLEKPVCLVAHNGNRFDFPVLRSELSKIKKNLEEDVLCVDSLTAFQETLPYHSNLGCGSSQSGNVVPGIKPLRSETKPSSLLAKCDWSNEDYDDELGRVTELAEKLYKDCDSSFDISQLEMNINVELDRMRKLNENTPIRKSRRPMSDHTVKDSGVKRKLVKDQQPKKNYKLSTVYSDLTGKEIENAHRAEVDALSLLECVTVVGKPILEWMDKNRVPFRSIKKMW